MNVLIYALGGGWGHITRAASLASALSLNAAVKVVSNSPYLSSVRTAMPELSIETTFHPSAPYEILVVDTFPRGILGELAGILPASGALKVLVHRDLRPEYISWANLRPFVAANFNCVLCPGERGPLADLPQAIATAPWLIRPPAALQRGVDVLVCASGNSDELSWYGEVTERLAVEFEVRCVAPELPPGCPPELWIQYWPSIDWISGARAVIGGAGYNTVAECAALGVPLIAHPWRRKYDRQRLRAEQSRNVTIVDSPIDAVHAVIQILAQPRNPAPPFRNGAQQAAEAILALFALQQRPIASSDPAPQDYS